MQVAKSCRTGSERGRAEYGANHRTVPQRIACRGALRWPPTQTPSPETARCSIGPTVAGGRAAPTLGMLTAAASGADRWAKRDVGIVVTLNITRTEYTAGRTLQLRFTIPSAGLAAVVSLSFCGIKRAAVTGAAAAGRPVEDDAAARDPVRQKYEREPDAASVG